MKTHEIIERIREISQMITAVNDETGEFLYTDEQIEAKESEIGSTRDQKLNAIQDYKLSLKDEIQRFKDKKAKQDANIKRVEKQQEYLKELQTDLLGGDKLKTDEYNFYYSKSKSVVVPKDVEVGFKDCIKTKYEWDKPAIKKLLESGIDYSEYGIYLEEKVSLSVR